MLQKGQVIFIAGFVIVFLAVYFGLKTNPGENALIEKSRVLNQENIDIREEIRNALQEIDPNGRGYIQSLISQNTSQTSDSLKVQILQELAGAWFEYGYPAISGHYAEEIAQAKEEDEDAWAMAGTTFALGLQSNDDNELKIYCQKHAISAFENAISINPGNISHRINMALTYVEFPAPDDPMKGITMLLDLNNKYPENTKVLNQLGMLAIRTGQFERAAERFESVIGLDQNNEIANCQLVDVYLNLGRPDKSGSHEEICNLLRK